MSEHTARVRQRCREMQLQRTTTRLAVVIANHWDEHGTKHRPAIPELMRATGLKKADTVIRHLEALRSAGILPSPGQGGGLPT